MEKGCTGSMPRKPSEFAEHPASFGEAQQKGLCRAVCKYVTDGDTFDVLIDLGFNNYAYETIRLHDVDTPEIFRPKSEDERDLGLKAKYRVTELIFDKPLLIRSFRDKETFGRFVADVYVLYDIEFPGPFVVESVLASDAGTWLSLAEILKAEGLTKSDLVMEDDLGV